MKRASQINGDEDEKQWRRLASGNGPFKVLQRRYECQRLRKNSVRRLMLALQSPIVRDASFSSRKKRIRSAFLGLSPGQKLKFCAAFLKTPQRIFIFMCGATLPKEVIL
ncbi:hypothetical protein I3843_09G128000 [Carya illinoinensis]|nr:hypothetical protein I3843_09G128000 [Carya illinoinensis]